MDKNVLDSPAKDNSERWAALEAELSGLGLIPLLERVQQRFDLSVSQLAVSAGLDEAAVRKILNGEKRRFKPEHVDALLDDLETCGKLIDPAEKWIWHRALRVAAHLHAITYKEIESILLKIGDPVKKAEALAAYVRNQYPALAQTHDDTGGLLPSVLPLAALLARRLRDEWQWVRVPDGYKATKVTDDGYNLIGKGLFPKKITDLGPELEVKDTGLGTYTIRRRRIAPPSLPKPAQAQPPSQLPTEEAAPDPDQVERQSGRRTGRYIEPELVRIPAGEFWMGSSERDLLYLGQSSRVAIEKPQHRVFLPEYWLARYPVTNAEYRLFLLANPLHPAPAGWTGFEYAVGKDQHPVVNVSWHDAQDYCRWLSAVTGKPHALPTEAEWEKAARGTDGRIYPWGNQWEQSKCNSWDGGKQGTTPVGAYSPQGDSPYGAADMAGNVLEWCHSQYKPYPYKAADGRESEAGDSPRVVRGGTWDDLRDYARCAYRNLLRPTLRNDYFGFRWCVVSAGSRF